MAFKRLVRFAQGGSTHFGDLIKTSGSTHTVKKLQGDSFSQLQATDEVVETENVCA